MSNSSYDLDSLLIQTNQAINILDRVDEALRAAEMNPATIQTISSVIVTDLLPDWLALMPELIDRANWFEIDSIVSRTEQFTDRLYKAVLRPRRLAFETALSRWLKLWKMGKFKLEPFLQDANDDQISAMEMLLRDVAEISIADSVLHPRIAAWLRHRFEDLRRIEKKPEHLHELLTDIHTTLSDAAKLDAHLAELNVNVDAQPDQILRDVAGRWLKIQYRTIDELDPTAMHINLATLQANLVSNWRGLDQTLAALGLVLQQLSSAERRLAQRELSGNLFAIQSLSGLLSKIIQRRTAFAAYVQLHDDGSPLVEPSLAEIVNLRVTYPTLPEPDVASGLEGYLSQIEHAHEEFTGWSTRFDDAAAELLAVRKRWRSLAERRGLDPLVVILDTIDEEPVDVCQLITTHNSLRVSVDQIRSALVANLLDDERRVYEAIFTHIVQGQDHLDLLDLIDGGLEDLDSLIRLARQKLVRLEIVL